MPFTLRAADGSDRSLTDDTMASLAARMRGPLIRDTDPGYEAERQIWNAMISRRPALIAQCSGTADVTTSVRFAADHGLLVSVRGGGHNIAGSALCDGGLMIDLSRMRAVHVDAGQRLAHVQGGALLGDVDHECQAHGLAVPTGINSTTGIGGLALGGGYGWLSRAFGHTVDNLLGAEVVTADGLLRRASATENPDLFWAIRGGGGNFGVVTEFTFRLHPVGPMILCGPVVHALEDAPTVLRAYREAVATLPDAATCWVVIRKAPPLPFLAPEHHGRPVVILVMVHAGPIEDATRVLAPLRGIGRPLGDGVGPNSYAGWQAAFDPLLTPGARNYWKSHDFSTFSDALIDHILSAIQNLPTDECEVFMAHLGGVAGRADPGAMAYAHRATQFTMNVHGRWQQPDQDQSCRGWVRSLYEKTAPLSEGSVYINFVPEAGETRSKGTFGANEPRLRRIKGQVDPANMFRANVQIQPEA